MTLFCDDGGWGSLLGGVAIGLYNDGNKKFLSKIIPVKYFQGKTFKKQQYLEKALDLFVDMEARIGPYSRITVCRGYILDHIWEFLQEFASADKLIRAEIKDPLQGRLELAFAAHLKKNGVPCHSGGAHGMSFEDQLAWVKADKKRIKFVKTGWPSWNKHLKKIS